MKPGPLLSSVVVLLGCGLAACQGSLEQKIYIQVDYGPGTPTAAAVVLQLYLVDTSESGFDLPDEKNPLLFTADSLPAVIELDVTGRDPSGETLLSIAGEAEIQGSLYTFGWEVVPYPVPRGLTDVFVSLNAPEQSCADGFADAEKDRWADCSDFDCTGSIYCMGGAGGVGAGSERCENYVGAGCDPSAPDQSCFPFDDDYWSSKGANYGDAWCAGGNAEAEPDCADAQDDDDDGAADCLDVGCATACDSLGATCLLVGSACGPAGLDLQCIGDANFSTFCTRICTGPASCGAEAVCVPSEAGGASSGMTSVCLPRCDPAAPQCPRVTDVCRPWDAGFSGGLRSVCAPGCLDATDCAAGETCDIAVGLCARPEGAALGASCSLGSECVDSLECFRQSWVGVQRARAELSVGICTRVGCGSEPGAWACPAASECLAFAAASICVPTCSGAGDDCSHPDFACVPDGAAGFRCLPAGWEDPATL